ncbi:hypothetical protein [Rugamonas aquatica]|uniref:Cytochrome c domain-containing protein n=1 Tax=Rugamonas aquatica TaxID=2743357 RepID=A0A6A7N6G8_9BURK|nr:hypothetical protein [Rugamonas aquatica]MQA40387.1 hypothetical protein [Rugamonas aquatica]
MRSFLLLLLLAVTVCQAQKVEEGAAPNNVGYDMYFNAMVVNDVSCGMTASNGRVSFTGPVTNPAMSCPDLLAWKLYIEVIQQNFIGSWVSGDLIWPSSPLPLCTTASEKNCCMPGRSNNPGYDNPAYPSRYCPFAPDGKDGVVLAQAPRPGMRRDASRTAGTPEVHGTRAVATLPLTFYNKPMFDYVFQNGLYHSNGLVAVLNNANADLVKNAPFHAVSTSKQLTSVNFPIDGWMIRAQWISKKAALAAGLVDDPASPFVKVLIDDRHHYNFNPDVFAPGEYWLMSFHLSTKDTPPWFWADFEHVNSPGRCDFTGCNDGYGFDSAAPARPGLSRNFTSAATENTAKGQVFVQNTVYPSGPITPALKQLFDQTRIGTGDQAGGWPTPQSKGWRSYRLRGSQWAYTDQAGRPSYLGSRPSNGGIVAGSSCVSCHATAGTTATGVSPQVLGLYINWAGTPNPGNFNLNARPATNSLLQNDFVWGFIHTMPLILNTKTGNEK